MNKQADTLRDCSADSSEESGEERARRVAEIKRLVEAGRYRVDSREILFNMIKTAP